VNNVRGSGTQRLWDRADIIRAAAAKALLDHGLSLQQARRYIRVLTDDQLLNHDHLVPLTGDESVVTVSLNVAAVREQVDSRLGEWPEVV
jgi:DNA-binding transcriptional MerR regulator